MGFGGRVSLGLAVIGALVLAGCAIDREVVDKCTGRASQQQRQWQLSDSPTCFGGYGTEVRGWAYAAGDMVFTIESGHEADAEPGTGPRFTMYDGVSGKQMWRHSIADEPTLELHDIQLVNGSGPLYVDGAEATVYASTRTRTGGREQRTLTALDGTTGNVESNWPITVANDSSHVVAVTEDVVLLADGTLYEGHQVGIDFVLRGISRTSGKELWTRDEFAPAGIAGTTLVGVVRDPGEAGRVVAIDVATGEDLWAAPAPAQALDSSDTVDIPYAGGRSVVVTIRPAPSVREESTTAILDAMSGKVVTTHPSAVGRCVGQARTIAACSTEESPLFFDPATGESVDPLVTTDGAEVTALTDDVCYVDADGATQVIAVGSGELLSDGQVQPVQVGNGFALTQYGEIYRAR
jgi:outer membrane protein assembly factor BamB